MRSKLVLHIASLIYALSLSLVCSCLPIQKMLLLFYVRKPPNYQATNAGWAQNKQAGWLEGKQHVWWVTCIHFSVKENRSNLFVRRSLIFRRPSLAWSFGRSACDTFSCLCVTLSVVACLQVEYFLCVVANKLNKNLHFFHTCVKVQKCLLVVYVVHSPGLKAPMLMSKEKKT